jgi:DNA-binding MarR family transcriptional regulator
VRVIETALLERLFESLQVINRALRAGSLAEGGWNITRVQWMILRHIRKHSDCTIGELAERLDVRPSTMSQMLDRLEKVDLVMRVPSPTDARVKQIRLTEKGHQVIRQVESVWLSRLRAPFAELTDEEQGMLVELLGKLAANVARRTQDADESGGDGK